MKQTCSTILSGGSKTKQNTSDYDPSSESGKQTFLVKCTACTVILDYAKLMLSPQQADVGNDDKVGKKQKEVGEAIMCPVTCSHPSKKKKRFLAQHLGWRSELWLINYNRPLPTTILIVLSDEIAQIKKYWTRCWNRALV